MGEFAEKAERVHVVQLFTRYYDLQSGGVSSKRANAEFVGSVAAEAVDRLAYDATADAVVAEFDAG